MTPKQKVRAARRLARIAYDAVGGVFGQIDSELRAFHAPSECGPLAYAGAEAYEQRVYATMTREIQRLEMPMQEIVDTLVEYSRREQAAVGHPFTDANILAETIGMNFGVLPDGYEEDGPFAGE